MRHIRWYYFWFDEVSVAAALARTIAIPVRIWFAGRTELSLAFIAAAVMFLPKLIQRGMKADADAIISAFGNEECHQTRVRRMSSVIGCET
ncbi:MAG: hypothetical protein M0R30_02135 [Methanoregula sp.]|uniref:hypothetical protein n=1 Tax=Methanoregula sp. TaxID=2052170 RepID=UPI0025F1EE67|nr:hypothetical protein [Methanoregula sp.]MCK9630415.1 hypothetical protein [Methanoregula sp.]